jgi:hypothetical protein
MGLQMFTQKFTIKANTVYHIIPRNDIRDTASWIVSNFEFAQRPTYLSPGLIMRGTFGTRLLVNPMDQDEPRYIRLEHERGLGDPVDVIENIFGPHWQSMMDSNLGPCRFEILDEVYGSPI